MASDRAFTVQSGRARARRITGGEPKHLKSPPKETRTSKIDAFALVYARFARTQPSSHTRCCVMKGFERVDQNTGYFGLKAYSSCLSWENNNKNIKLVPVKEFQDALFGCLECPSKHAKHNNPI